MAAPTLQFKRGAFSNLPALKAGEPGFTTDKYDLYVGLDSNSANNKFFGSHRYWTRETASAGSGINLVESTNGTDYVTLRAPASVGAAVTYIFPGAQGNASSVLTNDGSGNLSWSSGSNNATFTGITTFSDTTQSTSKDTGAVLLEGGIGIEKNVYVGGLLGVTGVATITSDLTVGGATTITGNLYVGGQSEFIGIVTFRGGTINLGDSGTDDVVIGGEFASDLIPTTDNTYSLGSLSKQWKDIYINGTADIDSLTVSGISTFDSAIFAGNGISVAGFSTIYQLNITDDLNVGGLLDVDTGIDVGGNALIAGITSFTNTTQSNSKDDGAVVIDGGVGIEKNVNIGGALNVSGNVTIGGTFVSLKGQDVFIENKDFILGYTTTTSPNDDSANHAGVAIASTEGSPLTSFSATGINTLPDTYKQLMWFKNGTLGFSTDAFAFNYALAIGTTSMANGVVLAVGSGVTASNNSVSATNLYGNGLLNNLNVSGLSTFVGVTTFQNNVYIGNQLYINGSSIGQDITARNLNITGLSTFVGVATFSDRVSIASSVTAQLFDSSNTSLQAPTVGNYAGERLRIYDFNDLGRTNYAIGAEGSNIWFGVDDNIDAVGFKWYGNTTQVARLGGTGNFTIAGDLQVTGNDIKASDGNTNITMSSNTLTTFAGDIKVGGNDIQASDGNTNITMTSNTLTTFAGDIKIGGNDIQASDGTTAITLTAGTGAVGVSSDLTVSGSLYVLGTTTEVNTETLKVEDSLIEVGLVNSGGTLVPPSSDLNIDVGVIFHYYTSSAKKAGVYWDDSVSRVVVSSDLSESSSVITSSAYADLQIGSLWVTDCAGTSQVVSCTGSERFLENITVDAGTF